MLPSILARQYQEGLIDYIDTSFPITNPIFKGSIRNMLNTKDAVFHEPYVAVRLPFRVYEGENNLFEAIHQPFSPYVHQQRAFERLTGEDGRSTLIATGTGSGKTECFLYPILEYCYRHRGEKGIKALIIYPMNALASDQAKRIAELVDGSNELKTAGIRVGMYVGGQEKTSAKMMLPDRVITDHDTLLAAPPDILMTNYKMLDYLLVRPKDAELWRNNNPDTLKYIAVDELHTFDGAQGTDLACLLRRLKARLNVLPGQICCIGTSATMGAKDSAKSIKEYASDVFGEIFDDDAVITEDRLSSDEFFANSDVTDYKIPSHEEAIRIKELSSGEDEEEYLRTAVDIWLDNAKKISSVMSDDSRVELGKLLMHHNFTQSIIAEAKGSYIQNSYAYENLIKRFPLLSELGEELACIAIDALYALISHARTKTSSGKLRPFLNVQVQVWMRELRRLVGEVADKDIKYALSTDLNEQQAKHYLPVINCRECGQTGWASVEDNGSVEIRDIRAFYNAFFSADPKVRIMFPHKEGEEAFNLSNRMRICPTCMEIMFDEDNRKLCSNGHETIPIWVPDLISEGKANSKAYKCPFCNSKGTLSIIGLRSATAISAGISELYASRFNDDKKLLAFTDNVQDAAHHAGFYNSRTWKFGLRTAITQFIEIDSKEYSFDEFIQRVAAYWKNFLGEEYFVSHFIPANLTWMRAYERMCAEGQLRKDDDAKNLVSFVEQRFKYETLMEYGVSSRIGRTLEKSGCSVLSLEFEKAIPSIMERVANEVGRLQSADVETFYKMVLGVLYQMKTNGAFTYYVFEQFIESGANYYHLSNDRKKWLPGVNRGLNMPKFVAVNRGSKKAKDFDIVNPKSWYSKWIDKYLPEFSLESDAIDIMKIILEELTKAGILDKVVTPDSIDVWSINPSKCTVTKDVKQMVCDECGSQISMSSDNAEIFEGACCTRHGCSGHMHVANDKGLDFYGKLYSQGELVRIVAKEHTGLLQRDDREELERKFKKTKEDKKPWEPNLLSCTPTLEMGIDIGDLSTVILSSIPPAQANYAQRAGRGGRKDGNALTVAIASARPHDLYFYQDPMEMIAGAVEPPKVFLKASAVLARQFTAYCMDCWVKSGKAQISPNVGACLAKLDEKSTERFPNNFLYYVQNNMTRLIRTFVQTFSVNPGGGDGLDEASIEDIKAFAMGDGTTNSPMHIKIYNEFYDLKKQRNGIQKSIKELGKMIKDLEAKPKDASYDEQIKELRAEKAAWCSVVEKINRKNVFNFLSDSGLLPNYAFPEEGIVLKAVLTRVEKDEHDKEKNKYESTTYEYNRSASAAISEFAPLNSFYAGGHKLTIDQVDINTAKAEPWRLCPNCSHAAIEDSSTPVHVCPKCGNPGWADAGQVRSMFKVQMVYSNMKEEESQIGDESEDRATMFYDKELLVEVDEDKDVIQAFEMDNKDFKWGYEFLQKATMREINFGEQSITGDKLLVAGHEGVRKGFTICKYCGKIQVQGSQPKHSRFCKMAKDKTIVADPFEECLFLYREFETEALRLLIPATTMDATSVRVESFVAAFMLGMKKKFGNVDHLRATVSEVPVPEADYRKQYLVIYDSVPGGTGYLKQLMNDKNGIIDVFEGALETMEHCNCNDDPQKDGCYKCLYAYRQSQHIGDISRDRAIDLLKAILSGKDNRVEIKKLSQVDTNHLFDSELEREFVGAFEKLGTAERPIRVHKTLVNEKEGYSLQVGEALWTIEPQVDFDEGMGISVKSRPDFVIRPKRVTGNQKPIAVFTDGFYYHKDIVEDDTLKRMAIMLSGKYRVWSLTYKDVHNVFKSQGDYRTETLNSVKMPSAKLYKPAVKSANAEAINPEKENSLELLVDYMSLSNAEDLFAVHARSFAMSIMDMKLMSNQVVYGEWHSKWQKVLHVMDSMDEIDEFGQAIYGIWRPRQDMGNLEMMSEVSLPEMTGMKMGAPAKIIAIIDDDPSTRTDKYEADWNGFWHFANVMQFNSTAIFLSKLGIEKAIYTVLGSIIPEQDLPEVVADTDIKIDDKWNDIMDEFIDDIAITCATEMYKNGIPAPSVVGYELSSTANGATIAEAEMAWEDRKIAWLLPDQEDYSEIFKKEGWTVLLSSEKITTTVFGGSVNE
ncbi:DEAD/DEAH box helicase [Butyrivibrio sp. XB500-5]|uniref:DEAD/DEAH box helicase n=1 Tax=Butyrivibrio sp. XB500-5 TaxID=2364880 RepID=UPI000EAA9EDA|nr:DEAD/DEAH box helicase [Butyrivibrio sp. XB500-5]RKM63016.1 DEAD/DEAH box helicase [Butyrivibrio sp. XB500-5]